MQYQWKIREWTEQEQAYCRTLQDVLHISLPSARLLVGCGVYTAEQARSYVRPAMDQLHDPFLMRDMDKAVLRLEQAIDKGEKILIYGDLMLTVRQP